MVRRERPTHLSPEGRSPGCSNPLYSGSSTDPVGSRRLELARTAQEKQNNVRELFFSQLFSGMLYVFDLRHKTHVEAQTDAKTHNEKSLERDTKCLGRVKTVRSQKRCATVFQSAVFAPVLSLLLLFIHPHTNSKRLNKMSFLSGPKRKNSATKPVSWKQNKSTPVD